MITVAEARARILAPMRVTAAETVSLAQAWNRVLAQDVRARLTQPPGDVSAMDGYAVRADDCAILRVIGEAPAGHPFAGKIDAGQAVRLFTGSLIPAGADAVVLQEAVVRDADTITLHEAAGAGAHIRRRGQDFVEGARVLAAGRRLGARDIGLAAASNHPWLSVRRPPVVAILSTGDEIVLPGEAIPPGSIVSSNVHMLAALVQGAGGTPMVLPICRDTPEAIASAVATASRADLLVTTGGASVGDHDFVRAGLDRVGFVLDFWKVAMRPGKPMISGTLGDLPVLGLPGNPVSAFVCAILFLWPAISRLLGLPGDGLPTARAHLGGALRANDHRADHLRATLAPIDGTMCATPFARQDSAQLSMLAAADCLILRAPHAPAAAPGEAVDIIPLSSLGM